MRKTLVALAFILVLGAGPLAQNAQAWVGVRVGIGVPLYFGPGPYYYGSPYYYYPLTYVAPAPTVIYQASPAVAATPPTTTYGTVVSQSQSPATPTTTAQPATANIIPASTQASPQVAAVVRQLGDATDTVRRDAALELGRVKALSAVDSLINMLQRDASPTARDGAARGLGLMGSPRGLNALIYAAQADNDREVRHSAQFAVEVIRSNLRGN